MASTYLCTDYNIKNSYPTAAKVVYMCSSLLQLAPGSRDLSQAEKKITVVKDEQTQNGKSCRVVNLLIFDNSNFLLS